MKNYFCAFLLFSFSYLVNGQTEKGSFLLGGNASADFTLSGSSNNYELGIYPNIGYFVANNIAIGAKLPILFSKDGTLRTNSVGFGPFARFYFANKGKSAFFVPIAFGFGKTRYKWDNGEEYSFSAFSTELGISYAYFLNKSIGLETGLYYHYLKNEDHDPVTGLALRLGFQIYFAK
jgi:hypothetical protein